MREPFRWKQGPLPVVGSDVLAGRPEWASKVGEVSAHWNVLDAATSGLFMILLAGEDEAAFFLYYEILKDPKRALREKIFSTVGEARKVPPWLMHRITDYWDRVATAQERRNEVVHALWASIEGHPDALFVVKKRFEWLRNVNAAMTCNIALAKNKSTYVVPPDLPTITEFYKYRLSDLQEIIELITNLLDESTRLQRQLANRIYRHPIEPPWTRAERIMRNLNRRNESKEQR